MLSPCFLYGGVTLGTKVRNNTLNRQSRALIASTEQQSGGESVGARLRRRRKALHLRLKEVAAAAGIAESFLSQLERGVHNGSIRTLQKICDVLGLTVGDLFASEEADGPYVSRFTPNAGVSFGIDARKLRLTPRSFDHLEVFIGVFEPYGSTGVEPYTHEHSEELIIALDGEVEVTIGSDTLRLGPLDSVAYTSEQPHRVEEAVGSPAKVLWAMAPPSY